MYGLSIDPNTKQSGVVAWKDGEYLWHDTKKPADGRTMAGTLWFTIYSRYPDWVAIEGVYDGGNAQTTIKLAKLVGALEEWCKDVGIPCYVLSTAEIDAACDIRPGLTRPQRKRATQSFARFIITEQFISQDVADAVCVGVAALGKVKEAAWAAESEE